VRIIKQLSNTPCIEEQNWGLGPNHDSIWVSGGCRAVFDVQPPRDEPLSETQYRDSELRDEQRVYEQRDEQPGYDQRDEQRIDEPRRDERYIGSRYARADNIRENARAACIDQAASDREFGSDQITASDAQWIGHGILSVNLDTPDGPMTCTVDRDGNVQSINNR